MMIMIVIVARIDSSTGVIAHANGVDAMMRCRCFRHGLGEMEDRVSREARGSDLRDMNI